MRNNLFLNRLLIYTYENKVAYDEPFHRGVNIIRGDNSSGKSTITHFIFYVLGGDFVDFVPEAKKCSVVYAEVEMNNSIITLKREIVIKTDKDGAEVIKGEEPIYFYWGKLDESLSPPPDNHWNRFGYKTLPDKKSFSNVLFENLDFPIIKEDGNNITFNQILRLLYIDQESPTSSLFLYEQFDSQLKRETVADLLLGVYNQDLYDKKKRKIEAEKEFSNLKSEIKVTEQFFSDPLSLVPGHLLAGIENKQIEINDIEEKIIGLKSNNYTVEYNDDTKLEFENIKTESIFQRKKVADIEDQIRTLEYEIEDSSYFIENLEKKIKALKNSIQTREFLGSFPLEYCPECLTPLNDTDTHTKCKLCKENIDETFGVTMARKMEQEISFQIKESLSLLEFKKRSLLEVSSTYNSEKIKLTLLQKQVNSSIKDVKPIQEEVIEGLYREKGFVEGEILQLRTLLENAELYQKLIVAKQTLEKELAYLTSYIWKTESAQNILKEKVNEQIKEEGVYLLNNDLDRQDDFKFAKEFYVDYRNNIAFLSNKYSKYSASSNFYLKVSARFAVFLASLSIDAMRFPRFIFADNMEDKGIEPPRAQNLQKILIDRVSQFDSNSFQIIYTTSYITPELNNSSFCVGEFYTKLSPSLKNV